MPTTIVELKEQIDLALNDNVLDDSVSPSIQATQIKSVADFVVQETNSFSSSSQGLQGIQGIQGIPGAVGPAGLLWRGAFVGGTSYVLNDAVGFLGASYYCILETTSIATPNLNTVNWALLASEGSPGPQGIPGIQGPPGGTTLKTLGSVPYGTNPTPLTFDINFVFQNGNYALPQLTNADVGKEIVVFSTTLNILVKPFLAGASISSININGFSGQYNILENQRVRFIYLGNDIWFAEFINTVATVVPIPVTKVQKTIITAAQALQLFTTPFTILSNSGTTQVRYPISIYIRSNAGDPYVLADSNFRIQPVLSGGGSGNLISIPTTILSNVQAGFAIKSIESTVNANGTYPSSYTISLLTSNPTEGNRILEVYVTYIEITL